ncbi:hypothetical protein CYMTET_46166 [Cymbomonas tetramitiformis]|uniref:Uncharacterized protein n=1 Tax=Cymbomonas tetramitiformis TaxID=36881 RepID=A0AAE0BY08_9CHLO|nr:hypothetical protein CYMTET_46166 [Cymbomonas tetramitiformis]
METWVGADLMEQEESELVVSDIVSGILDSVFAQAESATPSGMETDEVHILASETVESGDCVWKHAAAKYLEFLAENVR